MLGGFYFLLPKIMLSALLPHSLETQMIMFVTDFPLLDHIIQEHFTSYKSCGELSGKRRLLNDLVLPRWENNIQKKIACRVSF